MLFFIVGKAGNHNGTRLVLLLVFERLVCFDYFLLYVMRSRDFLVTLLFGFGPTWLEGFLLFWLLGLGVIAASFLQDALVGLEHLALTFRVDGS